LLSIKILSEKPKIQTRIISIQILKIDNFMKKILKVLAYNFPVLILMLFSINTYSQQPEIVFGKSTVLKYITPSATGKNVPLKWISVNTATDTWTRHKNLLVCSGNPIGVMRSEKQYENFLLHIEWKHIEPGGNSGVFVWSNANPAEKSRLPDGVEVQMLELDWVNLHIKDGVTPPVAYVHGELFGVGGVKTIPDNPRGTRSKSVENRCKGKGIWNTYDVVCVDGVIKLSVNGKFVNGITQSSQRKGYICLESEGAEIHFRNLKITELPSGTITKEQTAPLIK
jgi:3-keto-disaccharide hydrolase